MTVLQDIYNPMGSLTVFKVSVSSAVMHWLQYKISDAIQYPINCIQEEFKLLQQRLCWIWQLYSLHNRRLWQSWILLLQHERSISKEIVSSSHWYSHSSYWKPSTSVLEFSNDITSMCKSLEWKSLGAWVGIIALGTWKQVWNLYRTVNYYMKLSTLLRHTIIKQS